MQHDRRRSLIKNGLLLVALLTAAPTCLAQPVSPEVEIDMSVLRQLKPPGAYAGSNMPLARPVDRLRQQPLLTAPAQEKKHSENLPPPPEILYKEPTAASLHALAPAAGPMPVPATELSTIEAEVAPLLVSRPENQPVTRQPVMKAVSFPVETRIRTESGNPAIQDSGYKTPVQPVIPAAAKSQRTNIVRKMEDERPVPLPQKKPAFVTADSAELKPPPLPPRRPAIQQASRAFVEKARRNMRAQEKAVAKKTSNPATGGKNLALMPAVPTAPVKEELLADPLARQLLEPDRFKLAKAIDRAYSQKQEANNVPKADKNLGALTPMPLPDTEPYAAAAPPASQEQHILPFAPGMNELADDVATALEQNILPRLKQDPGLRLQINGFATSAENVDTDPRRISLARALSVRSWLLDKGVEAQRMDIRALGLDTVAPGHADRVVLVLFDPNQGT